MYSFFILTGPQHVEICPRNHWLPTQSQENDRERVKEGPTYALISNPPNGCENWRRVGVRKQDKKGETRGVCGDGVEEWGVGGRGRSVG